MRGGRARRRVRFCGGGLSLGCEGGGLKGWGEVGELTCLFRL